MKLSRPRLFALALAASVLATPASGQWKWRDAQGKVQYSDLPPPPSVPDRDVLKRPAGMATTAAPSSPTPPAAPAAAASAPATQPPATGTDKELEARRRAEEQAQEAKRRADEQRLAKERAEYCDRARGYLRALENGERVARTSASGEREILDDAQRARETAQTRKVLSTNCK